MMIDTTYLQDLVDEVQTHIDGSIKISTVAIGKGRKALLECQVTNVDEVLRLLLPYNENGIVINSDGVQCSLALLDGEEITLEAEYNIPDDSILLLGNSKAQPTLAKPFGNQTPKNPLEKWLKDVVHG